MGGVIFLFLCVSAFVVVTDKIDSRNRKKYHEKVVKIAEQNRKERYASGYKVTFRKSTNKYNDIY